ncbi:MAG: beta-ketoacyl synthase N-terminal-like domain-containing protein, partial [Bacteroidota bacterium]
MKPVYIIADNIITSLGFTTDENVASLKKNVIGLKPVDNPLLYPSPITLSRVDTEALESRFALVLQRYNKNTPATYYTRLEKLFLIAISDVLSKTKMIPSDQRTLLVISTTKGNVDLLEERYKAVFNHRRLFLWEIGRIIADFFGFRNTPVIVSNACISGLVAITTAARYIQSGYYDHAIVAGGDIISEFVI